MALSQSTPQSTSHSQLPTRSPHRPISLGQRLLSTKDAAIHTSVTPVEVVADNGPPPAWPPSRLNSDYKHRQSTLSTASGKPNRTGIFILAALARDKTTNAIASFSEPSLRLRPSSGSLYRSAHSSPTSATHDSSASPSSSASLRSADSQASPRAAPDPALPSPTTPTSLRAKSDTSPTGTSRRQALLETNPPSQAYSDTAADTRLPIAIAPHSNYNKMHQTSSRLLRMTSDDRPFTRVGRSRSYVIHVDLANARAGLYRSLCNTGRQPSAYNAPHTVNEGGPLFLIRRGHQQPGLLEVLPIQPYARSKRSFADSDHYHNHHLFHGAGDGSFCVSTLSRRTIH